MTGAVSAFKVCCQDLLTQAVLTTSEKPLICTNQIWSASWQRNPSAGSWSGRLLRCPTVQWLLLRLWRSAMLSCFRTCPSFCSCSQLFPWRRTPKSVRFPPCDGWNRTWSTMGESRLNGLRWGLIYICRSIRKKSYRRTKKKRRMNFVLWQT